MDLGSGYLWAAIARVPNGINKKWAFLLHINDAEFVYNNIIYDPSILSISFASSVDFKCRLFSMLNLLEFSFYFHTTKAARFFFFTQRPLWHTTCSRWPFGHLLFFISTQITNFFTCTHFRQFFLCISIVTIMNNQMLRESELKGKIIFFNIYLEQSIWIHKLKISKRIKNASTFWYSIHHFKTWPTQWCGGHTT